MSVNVQELYQQTVLPLPEPARLQLMALIADDLARSHTSNGATAQNGQAYNMLPTDDDTRAAEARFARWIGSVNSGNPRSADNEQIDADLAREYGATHDDQN